MKATYSPGFPGSGPWWESPRGWGQGRGLAPSPHKPESGSLPVAKPGRFSWDI
ncbi:hypothetical protein MBBA_1006 [Methanoculleus bourgensis]|jgi:hypothetical protein|nr:hypothetical protein MBBA_1006 [Methanoculleus bourgensis]